MRFLSYLLGLSLVVGGGLWLWKEKPEVHSFISQYISSGEFLTLEAHYTPDQLMERERKNLLKDSKYTYLDPQLQFYPYSLFEVKYTKANEKTAEGLLLWSLDDGELVLDTTSWETTHGFEDCINSQADKNDFKLLRSLARARNNTLDREKLLKDLHIEGDFLDNLIDSCRKKRLIVQQGNSYRLHFNEPRLTNIPETKIDQWLVTKPYKNATCVPKKYSVSQIEDIAKAAFESDFTVRNVSEVYLPVYSITVQNPDNSILTTHWNALNGKRIHTNKLH